MAHLLQSLARAVHCCNTEARRENASGKRWGAAPGHVTAGGQPCCPEPGEFPGGLLHNTRESLQINEGGFQG